MTDLFQGPRYERLLEFEKAHKKRFGHGFNEIQKKFLLAVEEDAWWALLGEEQEDLFNEPQ